LFESVFKISQLRIIGLKTVAFGDFVKRSTTTGLSDTSIFRWVVGFWRSTAWLVKPKPSYACIFLIYLLRKDLFSPELLG